MYLALFKVKAVGANDISRIVNKRFSITKW